LITARNPVTRAVDAGEANPALPITRRSHDQQMAATPANGRTD